MALSLCRVVADNENALKPRKVTISGTKEKCSGGPDMSAIRGQIKKTALVY